MRYYRARYFANHSALVANIHFKRWHSIDRTLHDLADLYEGLMRRLDIAESDIYHLERAACCFGTAAHFKPLAVQRRRRLRLGRDARDAVFSFDECRREHLPFDAIYSYED